MTAAQVVEQVKTNGVFLEVALYHDDHCSWFNAVMVLQKE